MDTPLVYCWPPRFGEPRRARIGSPARLVVVAVDMVLGSCRDREACLDVLTLARAREREGLRRIGGPARSGGIPLGFPAPPR
jgi:hypothetical protein